MHDGKCLSPLVLVAALFACGVEPSTAAGAKLDVLSKPKTMTAPAVNGPAKTMTVLEQPATLKREAGQIRFGDGIQGRRPPTQNEPSERPPSFGQRAMSSSDLVPVAHSEPAVTVGRASVEPAAVVGEDDEASPKPSDSSGHASRGDAE